MPETITFRDVEPLVDPEPVITHCKVRHGELDTLRPNGRGQPGEAFVHCLHNGLHELVIRIGLRDKPFQRGFLQDFSVWFRGRFGVDIPRGIAGGILVGHCDWGLAHFGVGVGEEVWYVAVVDHQVGGWL
jgi:hypothetical protein